MTSEVKDTEGLSTKYSEIINIEDYFLLDSRDQKQYRTVKIGTQLWMAENLNFVTDQGSFCHDNDYDICSTYGRLYEWETTTYACPNGWRLPTIEDWDLLIDYLGENESAQLRSDHGWLAENHGTNSSGFNALPASYLTEYGEFMALGGYAFFWTSTENDENTAWNIMLSYNTEVAEKNFYNKNNALSVRCLKN